MLFEVLILFLLFWMIVIYELEKHVLREENSVGRKLVW